jgi:hypothetical protein
MQEKIQEWIQQFELDVADVADTALSTGREPRSEVFVDPSGAPMTKFIL